MARTKITKSDKEVMIRFGRVLEQKMQSARLGFTDVSKLTGGKVKVSYISDVVRAARGDSQKFFRMGRDKVAQIAAALNWDEGEALRLAGLHSEPRPANTLEEALKTAFYFDQKGLSEKDIETLRPLLEMMDREVDRLKE